MLRLSFLFWLPISEGERFPEDDRFSGCGLSAAGSAIAALKEKEIVDVIGIVGLDATAEMVKAALPAGVPGSVLEFVLRSRYRNLCPLLRDQVNEDVYMRMVRINILVDVQGEDLLMRTFTSKVLSGAPNVEVRVEVLGEGREADVAIHEKEVQAFTNQLDESNPILTAISDATTAEGLARERGGNEEAAKWAAEKAKGKAWRPAT